MKKDENFKQIMDLIDDFHFGEETALVFDDMVERSVPCYSMIQHMVGDLASDYAISGSHVYDLGCSTGTTLLILDRAINKDIKLYGLDSSPEMLAVAERKLRHGTMSHPYELVCQDLEKSFAIDNASVVVMNLTLQFVRPVSRAPLIERIAAGVPEGGCLLLVEKVLGQNSRLNRLFIKRYYDFKKQNGYSDMEIAQKREALENVLIPYHVDENRGLLLDSGFQTFDVFFRWYNFCGMIAIK